MILVKQIINQTVFDKPQQLESKKKVSENSIKLYHHSTQTHKNRQTILPSKLITKNIFCTITF